MPLPLHIQLKGTEGVFVLIDHAGFYVILLDTNYVLYHESFLQMWALIYLYISIICDWTSYNILNLNIKVIFECLCAIEIHRLIMNLGTCRLEMKGRVITKRRHLVDFFLSSGGIITKRSKLVMIGSYTFFGGGNGLLCTT